MKITVEEIDVSQEEEVIVRCHELNSQIRSFIEQLKLPQKELIGYQNGEIHRLKITDIFYFEVVDNHSFIYCEKDVFESKMRLYEFEEICQDTSFFRAGKSLVLNSDKIEYIEPSFSGRFEVTLMNKEKRIVSRQYVKELKKRLGV
ncbi:MAG: LytTR family DNA-binding domain-containing protein [Lachnospiraceae bacterium]|nr:LytTR family DNA-binding domain-containing protein [Lachnospiraceae bacterium]